MCGISGEIFVDVWSYKREYNFIVNHRHCFRPHHHTLPPCVATYPLLEYAKRIPEVSPRSLVLGERSEMRGSNGEEKWGRCGEEKPGNGGKKMI